MDLTYLLNPVSDRSEIEEGDYVVAVTRDAVYMDSVEDAVYSGSDLEIRLEDGVLEPDHSHLDVSPQVPLEESPFDLNDVEEIYRVPEDVAPEMAYSEQDLVTAAQKLQN